MRQQAIVHAVTSCERRHSDRYHFVSVIPLSDQKCGAMLLRFYVDDRIAKWLENGILKLEGPESIARRGRHF